MKKLFCLFLALCLFPLWVSCDLAVTPATEREELDTLSTLQPLEETKSLEESGAEEDYAPLLYHVTDGKGGELYLLGSIHVGREEFYPLPSYVSDALLKSDALAVEVDVDAFNSDLAAQMKALALLCIAPDGSITDYVSQEVYEAALEILKENGNYVAAMDLYMPSLWASQIDGFTYKKIGADGTLGVDKHLLSLARENDISILEIESAELQYGMLANFSPELQEYLLKGSINSYRSAESGATQTNLLMDLWAFGSEEEFAAALAGKESFSSEEEEALYREYYSAMYSERNENMTSFAVRALRSEDTVFICVGAGHVIPEDGMVSRLRNMGYTVTLVKDEA